MRRHARRADRGAGDERLSAPGRASRSRRRPRSRSSSRPRTGCSSRKAGLQRGRVGAALGDRQRRRDGRRSRSRRRSARARSSPRRATRSSSARASSARTRRSTTRRGDVRGRGQGGDRRRRRRRRRRARRRGDVADVARRSARAGGRIVVCGATSGPEPAGGAAPGLVEAADDLRLDDGHARGLRGRLRARRERPRAAGVDSVFPLAEARAAHERLEAGEQFGKIVLSIT